MKKASVFAALIFLFSSCTKDIQETNLRLTERKAAAAAVNATLDSWMTSLSDDISLARLSIPGTHDAGARVEPIGGTAKCQNLTIAEQLNAGVRFLDIRCRHIGDAFAIHHGSIYQNLNFQDVINACNTFLNSHPGETIMMCVKEEYNATDNTRSFEATFDSYTAQNPSRWYLSASVPTLGQVRGKIVLVRRFGATGVPKGINASSGWSDNTTFSISNADANLRVQDQYVVPDNNAKWNGISALLSEAAASSNNTLYLNFASGYKSLIFGIPSITTVSNNINPRITTYFTTNTQGHYGTLLMDFADAAKAQLIVNTNF